MGLWKTSHWPSLFSEQAFQSQWCLWQWGFQFWALRQSLVSKKRVTSFLVPTDALYKDAKVSGANGIPTGPLLKAWFQMLTKRTDLSIQLLRSTSVGRAETMSACLFLHVFSLFGTQPWITFGTMTQKQGTRNNAVENCLLPDMSHRVLSSEWPSQESRNAHSWKPDFFIQMNCNCLSYWGQRPTRDNLCSTMGNRRKPEQNFIVNMETTTILHNEN